MDTSLMDTLEGTMKTTLEFLDAVKAKHGLTSDYQLSKLLECTHSAISNYRAGKSRLDEETACKVADLLGIEGGFVLSCIAAERSKNAKVKKAWAWTAQHLGGLAAALALVAILPFIHLPETGLIPAAGAFDNNDYYASGIYIMRTFGIWFAPLIIISFLLFPKARHDDSPRS